MASGNTPDFSQFDPIADPQGSPADAGFVVPIADDQGANAAVIDAAGPVDTTAKPADAKPAKPKPSKPPFTVYTLMLILSLVFIVIAAAMLVTELRTYNWEIQRGKSLF